MFPNQFTDSLWGDEAFSVMLSQKPLWEMIQIVAKDTSPPLYYLSEHLWFKLFGTSEIAIRSLSFLFHLGTAIILFLLAKFLWNKKNAIWTAILVFLNPFLFTYAFEGRMYALLTFTTTLSFYTYFRAFHDHNKKKNLKWKLFYSFAAAAALYSHHFALLAFFVQGLWILPDLVNNLYKNSKRKARLNLFLKQFFSFAWPFLLTIILYLPWLPALYYQTTLVAGGFWLATPTLENFLGLIQKFSIGAQTYKFKNLTVVLIVLLILSRQWQFKKKTDWILISWFLLPLILTWSLSQVMQSIFFDRYLLFTIPALVLILTSRKRTLISLPILLLIMAIFTWTDWHYFTHPNKRPFRELASYVHQELKPTDALINWNSAAHHLWETQYYDLTAPIYSPGGPLPFFVGTAQMTKKDVIYTPPPNSRIGVITSGPIEEVMIPDYQEKEIKEFADLKVIWLEKTVLD